MVYFFPQHLDCCKNLKSNKLTLFKVPRIHKAAKKRSLTEHPNKKGKTRVKAKKLQNGIIKRHADGFGFFIPDDPSLPDVYIPKHYMLGVMSHDRALIEVSKEPHGQRFRGEVIRITSRGFKFVVGPIQKKDDFTWIINDEAKAWGRPLIIKNEHSLGAKAGDFVHAEILCYPDEDKEFEGRVSEIIGRIEDPLSDVLRVLKTQNVPLEFSPSTFKEIQHLAENPTEKDFIGRTNLQNIPFITIDGATAKDFDDAIYCKNTKTGFHLQVAIADVSHYVKPGTSLDENAFERGTSVYFPNYVVPMLPEILSNGLCSLKEGVPRLALVCELELDFNGHPVKRKFFEAVIKSQARVTYGEAQEIIDGALVPKLSHVYDVIRTARDLAKILLSKRMREGSLDLELSETILEIDALGNPVDVQKSERLFAHRLIEELMLAANVAVAEFFNEKAIPGIYRIHEAPLKENIESLARFLHNLGVKFNPNGKEKLQKGLSRALSECSGKPQATAVNILTLRSMNQAKYSAHNKGHFGLGFDFYTHFTSPIRRYPDLVVHRIVKSLVANYPALPEEDLETIATLSSAAEQRAVKTERSFQSIKKARFMNQHLGQEFLGMISSVARFGIFVLLREFDIDGLVKIECLGNDHWIYDEENLRLIGKRSKKIYSIGQTLKVRVTATDAILGQIDFELVHEEKPEKTQSAPLASPKLTEDYTNVPVQNKESQNPKTDLEIAAVWNETKNKHKEPKQVDLSFFNEIPHIAKRLSLKEKSLIVEKIQTLIDQDSQNPPVKPAKTARFFAKRNVNLQPKGSKKKKAKKGGEDKEIKGRDHYSNRKHHKKNNKKR